MVIDEAEPPMPKPFHSLSHPVGAAVNEPMLLLLPLANSGHEIRLVLDEMVTGAKNENSNVPCESHTLIYLLELGKFSAAHGIATPIVAKVEYFDSEGNFEYNNFDYANL